MVDAELSYFSIAVRCGRVCGQGDDACSWGPGQSCYLFLDWPSVVEMLRDFVFVFAIFVVRVLEQDAVVLVVAAAVVEFVIGAESIYQFQIYR